MLEHGGSKILPVIPQLIIPIKSEFINIIIVCRTSDQAWEGGRKYSKMFLD